MTTTTQSMSPAAAFRKLREGHQRFQSESPIHGSGVGASRREELLSGQAPFATVLTCSDSRVSPEHIFDAGLGDLFVCRNAGNLLDELTLGSIEYAAAHTGCPLLMVLGHQSCGAVTAAVSAAENPEAHETHNVDDILRRLMPPVLATRNGSGTAAWVERAIRKNVEGVCRQITQRSPLLKGMIDAGEYRVVGGIYDLNGPVRFLADL
jgi:carbonic anhydrase